MRRILLGMAVVSACAAMPALGQSPTVSEGPYRIIFDAEHDLSRVPGKGFEIKVRFGIVRVPEAKVEPGMKYRVIVEEEGQRVRSLEVDQPTPNENLTAVLAMDTSGSMSQSDRMEQARSAANVFFEKLPKQADCGLILFDHEMRVVLPPTPVRASLPSLRNAIDRAEPRGGTAYLDACVRAVKELSKAGPGKQRAIVVMTDGVDLNSDSTVEEVIRLARERKVKIYTVGIGEKGSREAITSVLVLDRSGSMEAPADDNDTTPKITALKNAAKRFVKTMSASARTTLLPFGSDVESPAAFSKNKVLLTQMLNLIRPSGETALFDAVYAGLETLEAERPKGKRAVIAMTDGIDNSSRRRAEEVIARARELKIPLYLLGFGRKSEIDEPVMRRMADATKEFGGRYYHAQNEKALLEIFENLSTLLHDDGVNEDELKLLARETRGAYYAAKDVKDLRFVLEQVTQSIQKGYEITFTSSRPKADGTFRHIVLKLVRSTGIAADGLGQGNGAGGEEVVGQTSGALKVHGLVVAEMSPLVYLMLMLVLGALLALPEGVRRLRGKAAQI